MDSAQFKARWVQPIFTEEISIFLFGTQVSLLVNISLVCALVRSPPVLLMLLPIHLTTKIGMTERASQDHIDLFFRQGLIGGDKVPVIWSAGGNFNALKMLHQEADADVGEFGLGLDGVILTESEEQAKTLPWAVRYLQCHPDHASVCKQHDSYCAKCWVPREDVKPEVEQRDTFGSQVSWHPGWRQHQLTGRVIAFSILEALQQAVQQFSDGTMGKFLLIRYAWSVQHFVVLTTF